MGISCIEQSVTDKVTAHISENYRVPIHSTDKTNQIRCTVDAQLRPSTVEGRWLERVCP
jgi:hypothetical protein